MYSSSSSDSELCRAQTKLTPGFYVDWDDCLDTRADFPDDSSRSWWEVCTATRTFFGQIQGNEVHQMY
jgi:hypothetical protein